jgi:PIN domain nuclease of toxin-antitoxin system
MRLLLDTNVLLWTLAGHQRVENLRERITSEDNEVFVSVASWWEVAIKAGIGKLVADVAQLRQATRESGFLELPILGQHTEALTQLPNHHKDPFDRILVAQALSEPMRLLTGDALLSQYGPHVEVI